MIRPTRVHQFHSGAADRDAITANMIHLQRHLRAMGFESEIFAQYRDPNITHLVRDFVQLKYDPQSLLLFHHSMGHAGFDAVTSLGMPIVPVYHNITPPELLSDGFTRTQSRLGREQLRRLAQRTDLGIADSNYNRREMLEMGFRKVVVIPVRTDFADVRSSSPLDRIEHRWLFVGRIAPNKHQREIIREFDIYRRSFAPTATLHLVGDTSMIDYVDALVADVESLGLSDVVTITGKVTASALRDEYAHASLFVSLSRHEGFGVPLLEAMAAGVPVVALNRAAVSETMGGAGVLLRDAPDGVVASVANVLTTEKHLTKQLVAHQKVRIARIEGFDVRGHLSEVISLALSGAHRQSVQLQGPFETSYSLAILNRELALGLSRLPEYDVSIRPMDGPGDYVPRKANLDQVPEAAELYHKGRSVEFPDVAIRQMYPPRVYDSLGGLRFQYFGWEESLLPTEIVDEFNANLDGIGVMSTFVRDVLERSGVGVPMEVVGVAVDKPLASDFVAELPGGPLKQFRFLHISSAFPRKGVDVLLTAYFRTFTSDDAVTLILKTFPNPHNDVAEILSQLRAEHPSPPDVRWVDKDLPSEEIGALYGRANCYVHVARGEGFGLPVAEAMLARLPVISVASTGLADFVSHETARVVGHRMTAAKTHLSVPNSEWAEPNPGDLEAALREEFLAADPDVREQRVDAAQRHISGEFSANAVTMRWQKFLHRIAESKRPTKVAIVSTYNSRCGIAEYTASIVQALGTRVVIEIFADCGSDAVSSIKEEPLTRNWEQDLTKTLDSLLSSLDESDAYVVHVQFNYGFFHLRELARLITTQSKKRRVIVTLHRTEDLDQGGLSISLSTIVNSLAQASALIVHQGIDRARLVALGLTNVELIPIGTDRRSPDAPPQFRDAWAIPEKAFVVGSFGFLLPHKGTIQLIRSLDVLRKRHLDVFGLFVCALHPNPVSQRFLTECQSEIERLDLQNHLRLVTEYLPDDVARELLRCADVLCLPYEPTSESSSAALRFLLPIGRPIITTDLDIFRDARDVVATIEGPLSPAAIADKVENIATDPDLRQHLVERVAHFAQSTSWDLVARKTYSLYQRVIAEQS